MSRRKKLVLFESMGLLKLWYLFAILISCRAFSVEDDLFILLFEEDCHCLTLDLFN